MTGDCPFCSHDGNFNLADGWASLGTALFKAVTDPGQVARSAFSAAPVGTKGICPKCKSKVIECPHCNRINAYRTSEIEHDCVWCKKVYQI